MTVEDNICHRAGPARLAARQIPQARLATARHGQSRPSVFLKRYPKQLSGGQQQRVGVARALAADPPVLLMDEPFGAIDPINREVIQDEFMKLQAELKKTIVFVSHDIDEAVKMATRIAIFRDGKLIQYDTPDNILASSVDAFVSDFVGSDRALRRLSLVRAADAAEPGEAHDGFALPGSLSVREVLSALLAEARDAATILGEGGKPLGQITLAGIRARSAGTGPHLPPQPGWR
jgi:osmoprotectant transport system ATP-binding protein